MLDIEYIKQIDKVLEVQDYIFDSRKGLVQNNTIDEIYVDCPELIYTDRFHKYHEQIYVEGRELKENMRLSEDNPLYKLYLFRVIEAINKMFDDESIVVEYNHYQGGYQFTHLKHEDCSHKHSEIYDSIDEAKEKAIIYIMDHIKEKV